MLVVDLKGRRHQRDSPFIRVPYALIRWNQYTSKSVQPSFCNLLGAVYSNGLEEFLYFDET
jgi:hypothetical protein